jgi:hypothetical protein
MEPKLAPETLALPHFVKMVEPNKTELAVLNVIVKLVPGHLGVLDNKHAPPLVSFHEPISEPEPTRLLIVVVLTQPVLVLHIKKRSLVLVKIAPVLGLHGVAMLPVETLE